MSIRIPKNSFFNKDFRDSINKFLGSQVEFQKFKEINFFYLFNLPLIVKKENNNDIRIRINEDIDRFRWDNSFIYSIKNRKNHTISMFEKLGYIKKEFSLTLCWRLIVGLGASHPQETSMTLHHIYGIPFIPGSAIKGVTKQWTILKLADKYKGDNESFENSIRRITLALENGDDLGMEVDETAFKELIEIFGTQKKQGEVVFFDAYPTRDIKLKMDIMNPHYPKYYQGNEPPGDWQSPNPIKFLTVENTKFQFYLISKKHDLIEKAERLLKNALHNHGIGAKTSLGYGVFINADNL